MKLISCIVLLFLYTGVYSQADHFIIRGKVIDTLTRQPLAGASVFCQNTTIGSITNAEGEFSLRLPAGGYDLVVTYTGFESYNTRINNSSTDTLRIVLAQKEEKLSEVFVSASTEVTDGLAKYGKFFIDNFIGVTPNATQCVIQNPEALQFFFSKKRNRLKVKGKEDLIIINNALGYKIKYQLDSFTYEYANDLSMYSGFPFFEQMEGTAEQKEIWNLNRSNAYNGSRLHFLRSWYDSTLEVEGYVLEDVDTSKKDLTTTPLNNPYDSSFYSVIEDNDVEIRHAGRLRVIYKNEMPEQKYLSENKLPLYLKSQISLLDISDAFIIEQNGYVYEQSDLVNTGYWSWEKVAELVPYDYEPE